MPGEQEVTLVVDYFAVYPGTLERMKKHRENANTDAPTDSTWLCALTTTGAVRVLLDKGVEAYLVSDIGKTIERL